MSADLKKKAIECRLGHSKKHTLHSQYHPLLEEYTPEMVVTRMDTPKVVTMDTPKTDIRSETGTE